MTTNGSTTGIRRLPGSAPTRGAGLQDLELTACEPGDVLHEWSVWK